MPNNQQLVDHLFRHQYGKMVAILTRLLGPDRLDLAEDVVQDSFAKALSSWKINGLPDKPEAWLMRVAKNAAIDILRKEQLHSSKKNDILRAGTNTISIDNLFLENEIEDAQLRMIFCCCDPRIKASDQVALTLKIVSGFSNAEIANALLLNIETVKKRIQRAKKELQNIWKPFSFPSGKALLPRLSPVLQVIYLLFNEGYHSMVDEKILRKELCAEALRLGNVFCLHPKISHPNAYALMGLMCFHAARFESRFSKEEEIILLEEQDRSQWNYQLIYRGNEFMEKAVETDQFSTYHLQAAITSEYMKAKNFAATNWQQILYWYEQLLEAAPSPFIQLNKAIAHIYAGDAPMAQQLLDKIDKQSLAARQYLLHLTQGEIYLHTNQSQAAIDEWLIAHKLVPSVKEKQLLEKKIKEAEQF